ncbi:MAG: NAD(P)/FAD-dependent oxidoreductase [Acidobacteriota bacterium]
MTFDADVIVAGAGPAGAVAARTLAAAGVDTLLIDRAMFPRNKPCGGGLSARVLRRFPWLESATSGIDVHRIQRLHLEGPRRSQLDLDDDETCVVLVRRVEFDDALVREAARTGARVQGGFEITQADQDADGVTLQSRDGRRLRARLVVAADGVHSVLGKRLGVNPKWPRKSLAIDMMEETPVETLRATRPDVLWVAYAHNGLDGYAYVFPKVNHVNVGIGCVLSHFDEAVTDAPYTLQTSFVSSLVTRGVLDGGSDRKTFTPFLIPVGGPLPRAAQERVLFAGDAGGFVHAITAEGIYYAMVSGELAGRAIAATGLEAAPRRVGDAYERAWRREIGAELRDAVLVQKYLFSSHDRVAHVVNGASASASLTTLLLDYFKGHVSYGALRRRMILRFPMTIVRLATAS